MVISVDPDTYVISILQSELAFVGGSAYQLDTNIFRLALRDWEDNEEGIYHPPTHNHNTTVLLGGIQYARVLEILSPYTITFQETGTPYSVTLVGSNNNILEKTNLGTVQILSNNSAGLINVTETQYGAFDNKVTIDVDNGVAGTSYPTGTPSQPVNNLADALVIAVARGFRTLHLDSDLTITTGQNVDRYVIHSDEWHEVTVQAGVGLEDTVFERVSLYGVMGGFWNTLIDCWVYNITNFCGWIRGGSIENVALAAYTVANAGQSYFDDLVPMYPGITSIVTMNTDTFLSITDSSDIITVKSLTTGSKVECGLHGGELIVDATCVGGDISVSGTGLLTNNSALVVDDTGLVNREQVTKPNWDAVHVDPISGVAGTAFPLGTHSRPVNNMTDAKAIADTNHIEDFYIVGNITLTGDWSNYGFSASSYETSQITCSNAILNYTKFNNVKIIGSTASGQIICENCNFASGFTNLYADIENCQLAGTITMNSAGYINGDRCTSAAGATFDMNGTTGGLRLANFSGALLTVTNCTNAAAAIGISGHYMVTIANSCTAGTKLMAGIGTVTDNSTGMTTVNRTLPNMIWEELTVDHSTAGTTGKALSDAGGAGNPWGAPIVGNTASGTFGELVGKKLLTVAKFLGLK